jgi:hypothetical protein
LSHLVIKHEANLPPQEVCEEVLRIGAEGELIWEHYDAGPSTRSSFSKYQYI